MYHSKLSLVGMCLNLVGCCCCLLLLLLLLVIVAVAVDVVVVVLRSKSIALATQRRTSSSTQRLPYGAAAMLPRELHLQTATHCGTEDTLQQLHMWKVCNDRNASFREHPATGAIPAC